MKKSKQPADNNKRAETPEQEPMTDAQRESLERVLGAIGLKDKHLATSIINQACRLQIAWRGSFDGSMETAFELLRAMKPEDATQAMLAVQMIGVHCAFQGSLCSAAPPPKSPLDPDLHVARTTQFARLYIEQLNAMAKLQGKTRHQKVTVEHVNVNAGAPAIMGAASVAAHKSVEGESGERHKRTQ